MESGWVKSRKANRWSRGYVEWTEGDTAFLSVVFSWKIDHAVKRAAYWARRGYCVQAGGPAIAMNPGTLGDFVIESGSVSALPRHNPDATFTTRGCIRKCKFCAVPKIEGGLVELPYDQWEPLPIICDNNLLAASMVHFDGVIDRYLDAGTIGIDFNQGLDMRLMNQHHADKIGELHKTKQLKMVRIAWDHIHDEASFRNAYAMLREAGIPRGKISVYVLIGFNDTPDDALYRLSEIWKLRSWPNPMRYQPLDARKKNEYVGEAWTHDELQRYVRYWFNLRYTAKIPFSEFSNNYKGGPA